MRKAMFNMVNHAESVRQARPPRREAMNTMRRICRTSVLVGRTGAPVAPGAIEVDSKAEAGFEPAYNGFAIRPLSPLGYSAVYGRLQRCPPDSERSQYMQWPEQSKRGGVPARRERRQAVGYATTVVNSPRPLCARPRPLAPPVPTRPWKPAKQVSHVALSPPGCSIVPVVRFVLVTRGSTGVHFQ